MVVLAKKTTGFRWEVFVFFHVVEELSAVRVVNEFSDARGV